MSLFVLRLLFAQEGLLFQPTRTSHGTPRDVGLDTEDVELPLRPGVVARGWWIPAEPGAPAFLFLPGAHGNVSQELPTLRFLRSIGAGVLAIDYPGYGMSDGRPSLKDCRRAAEAAWKWLAARRPSAVFLHGRSLGSSFATELAVRHPAAGLVFHNGFSSLVDVVSRVFPRPLVRAFCRVPLDAGAEIGRCSCPVLVLHARQDEVIADDLGRRAFQLASPPKRFVALRGGHFGTDWLLEPEVRRSFRELLSGGAAGWGEGEA
jgi:hypothetical protein